MGGLDTALSRAGSTGRGGASRAYAHSRSVEGGGVVCSLGFALNVAAAGVEGACGRGCTVSLGSC